MNYFKLFQISEKINIDQEILLNRFYELQKQFHPDKFIFLSKSEQKKKLKKSIIINHAYSTLKDFFLRLKYLLFLKGFHISKKNNLIFNKNFLIKQFNLFERIEKLNYQKNNISELNKIKFFIKNLIKKYKSQIILEFNKKNWEKTIYILYKLSFFKKKYIFIKNCKI